jgi:hypothetical protein
MSMMTPKMKNRITTLLSASRQLIIVETQINLIGNADEKYLYCNKNAIDIMEKQENVSNTFEQLWQLPETRLMFAQLECVDHMQYIPTTLAELNAWTEAYDDVLPISLIALKRLMNGTPQTLASIAAIEKLI